jgi:AmmeMemoRadiSam system protein A
MALTSSTELSPEECETLLRVAREAIVHGLEQGAPMPVRTDDYPDPLREQGACFVTLEEDGQLRGCIGTLKPFQPLVSDVAEHAHAAAFKDPRFPPLREDELDLVEISISVLGKPSEMEVSSEDDLCEQLEPGVDGLILEYGSLRGTFLPSVWETLPDCRDFLRHLKLKAGLPADFWSDDLRVSRYSTTSFAENPA